MKILLIRHGETTGDIEGRYGGNYDDHLTELGKEQIGITAEKLAGKEIEVIFSSSLIRAKETAVIIQNKIKCHVFEMDGLQERNYGVLAGLTKAEAQEKYPEAIETHKDPLNTDPGGESFQDFRNRVLESFKSILAKNYKTVAVVSHGGPIKQMLAYVGRPIPEKLGDGEVIEIDIPSV